MSLAVFSVGPICTWALERVLGIAMYIEKPEACHQHERTTQADMLQMP